MAYKMPKVEVGMIVWWWYDQHTHGVPPIAAIVVKVATETIGVEVFEDQVGHKVFKDGVRHISDPNQNEHAIRECGVWDFSSRDKAINDMLADRPKPKAA